jgi:hypothetical protein
MSYFSGIQPSLFVYPCIPELLLYKSSYAQYVISFKIKGGEGEREREKEKEKEK